MSKNEETQANSPSGKKSWSEELKLEFKKISWPNKKVVTKESILVFVSAAILGGLVYGLDNLIKFCLSGLI